MSRKGGLFITALLVFIIKEEGLFLELLFFFLGIYFDREESVGFFVVIGFVFY